ncbi:hypothetical protein BDB01DRAFT_720977 [Pilobolus umbonatus]|nr:hypothetical protein BDB01DRAFT_720977 [Pilobolus umbonatus]
MLKGKFRQSEYNDNVSEISDDRDRKPPPFLFLEEDDILPSAEDILSQSRAENNTNTKDDTSFDDAYHEDKESESSTAVGTKEKEKNQWEKTFGKVRLITHFPHMRHRPKDKFAGSSPCLVPYYPPLFDPLFISINKHNKRWVNITDSEMLTQGIPQWVFRIELQYGDIKWVIKRTIAEFGTLHYTLRIKSSVSDHVPNPPNFPSQFESWLNSAKGTIRIDSDDEGEEKQNIALRRREALTRYLRKLLIRAHMMTNEVICEFLEISAVSIVDGMGWKGKEGFMENKINFVVPRFCQVIKPHLWKKQWVLLRDSYFALISDIASTTVNDVFLFDKNLIVENKTPGLLGKYHHHITIQNKFRRIEFKGSRREVDDWMASIKNALRHNVWIENHRFGSFAPIRENANVEWFVDGENHFKAVAKAILDADSEIFIADWWLSPELYLQRPAEMNEEYRLDRLLKRKAEQGVKIYIIIYKEMTVALTINSAHTKSTLQNLHKNIIVVRHPDHRSANNNVLFWSHHEKIVVVDNRVAFIGGLDLCWGRFDTQAHTLSDYPALGHQYPIFPGQDYSNPRVKDFQNVAQYNETLVDRNVTSRMPWHDMTVKMIGPIARDVARHFIQRWNFLKTSKGMHRPTVPILMPKGEYVAARDESSFKGTCNVQLLRSSAQWSSGIEREHSIYNAYMECISKSKHYIYIENQFFISATCEDKLLRNKIAEAIVERIKLAHLKKEKFKVFIVMPLIPAFEGDLASKEASAARNVMHFQYITISRGGNSIMERLKVLGIPASDYVGWYSLRTWGKIVPSSANLPIRGASVRTKKNDSATELSTKNDPLNSVPYDGDDKDDRPYYVSELIYIHDKILIVDDRFVLIGSDTEMVPSYMAGKKCRVSKFAHSLRMHLFKEHLGLTEFNEWDSLLRESTGDQSPLGEGDQSPFSEGDTTEKEPIRINTNQPSNEPTTMDSKVLDPLASHFYDHLWNQTAKNNTLIYRDLFRCVPDDTVHTFEQHRMFIPDPSKISHGHIANPDLHGRDIKSKLSKVRGHLVQFPCDYLKDENMLGSLIRETVTPMTIFT